MSPLASPGVAGEVLGGLRGRPAQPPLLPVELLGGDRAAERRQPAEADDDGAADGDARRNGEALSMAGRQTRSRLLLFLVEAAGDQVLDGGERVLLVVARTRRA